MSAQLDADLAKALADINAVKTDAAVDATAAAAALTAANASTTASQALVAQLTAVLRAKGFNPDGTPIAPPATPTFGPAVYDATAKTVVVPIVNVPSATILSIGRDGADSTGYGVWDTSQTAGSLAAFIAAGKATFTGMGVPAETFTFTLTRTAGAGAPLTCTITIPGTPVTPPPAGQTGKVRLGVYHFGTGSNDGSFDRTLGTTNLVKVAHIYWDMNDASFNGSFLDSWGPWLAADKLHRQALVGMSPLTDEAGNFGSTRVRQQTRDFVAHVKAKAAQYGFDATQVLFRFGYEANGDWMPWGKQFDSTGAGYRQMANDCKAIARAAIPTCTWIQCFTPWDNGAGSFSNWVLSGTDWEASSDTYDDYEGGLGQGSIDAHVNRSVYLADWCDAHGVPWAGYDEIAVCSTGDGAGGAGDNPAFITATFAVVVRRGKGPNVRYVYFDVNVQETSTTLAQNPNSAHALAVAAIAAA